MGWRGERVVAFEEMPRHGAERNRCFLETPVTMASGSFKSLLIQDREDRRKAQRLGIERLEGEAKAQSLDARSWAERVGFTPEQQPFAAVAAVILRDQFGAGNVTRQMVVDRCRAQYPHVFGDLSGERVA